MKQSLALENIKKIDRQGLLQILLDFPSQCRSAAEIGKRLKFPEINNPDKIIFAGVGGSAIGADFVRAYLYFESRLPIFVLREESLPAYADERSLVFIVSYSGNSQEAISCYKQARERGAFAIVISSDGELKEAAANEKTFFVEVPRGLPPRYALGYLSILPLYALSRLGLGKEIFIEESLRTLEALRDKHLGPHIGQKDNPSKYAAAKLYNKFPVIYASSVHFDVAATRLRSQLNENAKCLAGVGFFPETNHNEIMGWRKGRPFLKDFIALMFRDKTLLSRRINQGMDIAKDFIAREGFQVLELWPQGEDLLSRMFSLIYAGDFISFYLAVLYGSDPAPIERIETIKERLK